MEEIIQRIKCFFGKHLIRLKQVPKLDRYKEPQFYCLSCRKKFNTIHTKYGYGVKEITPSTIKKNIKKLIKLSK